nr:putative ribonuclease H-like domain-containing protein [Tanacetum cinerariifolium]
SHLISSVRTPQQNGVVERRNQTLVEAARIMLIFSHAPLFLWAKAIATACFTQNRFIIHRHSTKHHTSLLTVENQISHFFMYSVLCVIPRMIVKTLGSLVHISSGLSLTYAPSIITTQQPSEGELDLLFEAMYDDYIGGQPSATGRTIPPAQEPQVRQSSTASTTITNTAPI